MLNHSKQAKRKQQSSPLLPDDQLPPPEGRTEKYPSLDENYYMPHYILFHSNFNTKRDLV